jgi:isopenicillin N synthase-like dioxygenase
VTRYDGGFQRDWHEAIDLYKHFDTEHPSVVARRPLHGPNPWPDQVRKIVSRASPGGAKVTRLATSNCPATHPFPLNNSYRKQLTS